MDTQPVVSLISLAARLEVGDLIFIRVAGRPFREVADATGSWANHVGIVVQSGSETAVIAESTLPLSRLTSLAAFAGRSEGGRIAVLRPTGSLTKHQRMGVNFAARKRLRILYDTGFNLRSKRQFCSRFVREVIGEATALSIGNVETFTTLLRRRPQTDLRFWKLWFFGRIPWSRETVSPASLLESPLLHTVFTGYSSRERPRSRACGRR